MLAELDRRTLEYFEGDASFSHLDYTEALVAAGGSIQRIAEDLSDALGFNVDRETLRRHVYSLDADHAHERLARARERGAHAMAEESVEIVDRATPDDVRVAQVRARSRQWLAEKWNPIELAQQRGSSITINLGELHLAALRATPARSAEEVTGAVQATIHNEIGAFAAIPERVDSQSVIEHREA